MRCTVRHILPTPDPAMYWRHLFFDRAVQERIYRELGYEQAQVTEQEGSIAAGLRRTFVFAQPVRAPLPLKKLFGERQVLVERGTFDATREVYSFEIRPQGALESRIRIQGETTARATKDGAVERVCVLDCTCALPAVSGLAERFIVGQNQQIYERRAEIERRLLREGLAAGPGASDGSARAAGSTEPGG
jgi:hypothetical protein